MKAKWLFATVGASLGCVAGYYFYHYRLMYETRAMARLIAKCEGAMWKVEESIDQVNKAVKDVTANEVKD